MIELSYKELSELYPQGSDDPEVVELLRQKRTEVRKDIPPVGYAIGPDGRIYSQQEYDRMTPAQRRGLCVGSTCSHYEGDVPGMSDTD